VPQDGLQKQVEMEGGSRGHERREALADRPSAYASFLCVGVAALRAEGWRNGGVAELVAAKSDCGCMEGMQCFTLRLPHGPGVTVAKYSSLCMSRCVPSSWAGLGRTQEAAKQAIAECSQPEDWLSAAAAADGKTCRFRVSSLRRPHSKVLPVTATYSELDGEF
jgi:hypothetical protein